MEDEARPATDRRRSVEEKKTPRDLSDRSVDLEEEDEARAASPRTMNDVELEDESKPENEIPAWVKIPPGFRFRPGVRAIFVRIPAEYTSKPGGGERQCILWELNSSEERTALERSHQDPIRVPSEMAKMTIRAIDGLKVDWTGAPGPANVNAFWDDIGPKMRSQLVQIHAQTHYMTAREQADFFSSCVTVRSAT